MHYLLLLLCVTLSAAGICQRMASIDVFGGLVYAKPGTSQSEAEYSASWRAGLAYNHPISDRLYLRSGVAFSTIGYQFHQTDLRWGSEHDGNGGYVPDPTLPHELHSYHQDRFVELPLLARLRLGQGRVVPFLEAGLSPSVYLGSRTRLTTDLDPAGVAIKDRDPTYTKVQVQGIISGGVGYQISSSFQLFAQPSFRYFLTRLSTLPGSVQPYVFGLDIGLRRGLR